MSTDTTPAPVAITIHATLDGWPVDLALDLPPAKLGAALVKLATLGYAPRAGSPSAPAVPAARPKVEPVYSPDGTPCCPTHLRPLSEGRYGLYCSAKAAEGQPADKRGYCGLKFDA